jgi:hypothetical protein
MESINSGKFSRHLLIHLPGAAFKTGPELGKFVKQTVVQHKAAHTLRVMTVDGILLPFIDTTVYSRCG